MSDVTRMRFPSAGEKTLASFFEAQGRELKDAHHEVLNEIARALTERGWVLPIEQLVARLVEQSHLQEHKLRAAIEDLVFRHLLTLDATGTRVTGFLGCYSLDHTPHRALLANGIDVHVHGGFELLTVNSTLLKSVDVFSICPMTHTPLRLRIEKEQIVDASPSGISGFMAEWDGVEPLAAVAARSPLFADDDAAAHWHALNPGIRGTELPGDLLLWIGMEAARQLGSVRFRLIGHHD